MTGNGQFDPYSMVVNYFGGQSPGPGDSGSGLLLDRYAPSGALHRVIAAVYKAPAWSRIENAREWALSYLYGRPVQLPTAWFVDNAYNAVTNDGFNCTPAGGRQCTSISQYQAMWTQPLANNFDNLALWNDPCPGRNYTWSARYSLQVGVGYHGVPVYYDWITVTTNDPTHPGSTLQTFLGGGSVVSGVNANGPLTVRVHTSPTVQSPGIQSMSFLCEGDGQVELGAVPGLHQRDASDFDRLRGRKLRTGSPCARYLVVQTDTRERGPRGDQYRRARARCPERIRAGARDHARRDDEIAS